MTIIGIHTNAQNKPLEELTKVWRHADELGYSWISISDHFAGSLGPTSNEAVATHAAMACHTTRARCGVLVYCIGFRHPAVLAAAAASIDHLSGGRAAIGLGAGSVPKDYELYGFPFTSIGGRMDMLDEGVRCVSGLLRNETFDFAGKYFHVTGAPQSRPLQKQLPVWVGTTGEQRGLRIAASYADGWNAAFLTPDAFAHKRSVLQSHCADIGRDPAELQCSVNVIVQLDGDLDKLPPAGRASAILGSVDQIVDGIARYAEAGADQLNFQLPYPWDYAGLEKIAAALGLPAA